MDNRYLLHQQGLTDKQIAERLGIKRNKISSWRRYVGLPPNLVGIIRAHDAINVDATPLRERLIVRRFVGDLQRAVDITQCKPDAKAIGKYMSYWVRTGGGC